VREFEFFFSFFFLLLFFSFFRILGRGLLRGGVSELTASLESSRDEKKKKKKKKSEKKFLVKKKKTRGKKKTELRGQNVGHLFGAIFAFWPDLRPGIASPGRLLGPGSCENLWNGLVLARFFLAHSMVFPL
jgi:hypothetical protein